MKHRLSALALALSMGLSLASPIAADDFESNEFDDITETATTKAKVIGLGDENLSNDQDGDQIIKDDKQDNNSSSEYVLNVDKETTLFTKEKFPDPAFRNYLIDKFEERHENPINDLNNFDENLIIGGASDHPAAKLIKNLSGIEYLGNLKTISCIGLTSLADFLFDSNQTLSTVSITDCPVLTKINLDSCCKLANLTVKNNHSLNSLSCASDNQLTSLNIENNPILTLINCSSPLQGQLAIKGCSNLETLYVNDTNLTSLDIKECTKLQVMLCSGNKLLKSLDLSQNLALWSLNCNDNPVLESLMFVENGTLSAISCWNNPSLNNLDLEKLSNLRSLDCHGTHLASLDFSKNPRLETLNCSKTLIKKLDLSGLKNLKEVESKDNPYLEDLNAEGCINLKKLDCRQSATPNLLTKINIRGCSSLPMSQFN